MAQGTSAAHPGVPEPGAQSSDPRVGARLGRYRILQRLDEGSAGTVYEGLDEELQRPVAIEFWPAELCAEPTTLQDLIRAAQLTARLGHPNIITLFEVSKNDQDAYLVRELLHPASAYERLRSKGPYAWPVATRIVADCCAALRVAHAAGVEHGDLRPERVQFSPAGVVKLDGFGRVRRCADAPAVSKLAARTPHYLSPEQAIGRAPDARSDLYSLGATYYALLTGEPPFAGSEFPQILRAHLKEPTPDPRQRAADIPAPCVKVLWHAMEKERDARYQTADELAEDLESLLAGVPGRSASVFLMEDRVAAARAAGWPPTARSGRLNLAAVGIAQGPEPLTEPPRRRFLALSAAGLLGVMTGEYLLLRRGDRRAISTLADPAPRTAAPTAGAKTSLSPLKIGILHSLTGSLAVSEHPLADAALLALEELNARGGVLGRQLQPIVHDGRSEVSASSAFTRGAERLLAHEKVEVLFGGYGTSGRKFIIPYLEKYDRLLFYPSPYEGLEESQHVIYTGATPNQLGLPAVRWCMEALSVKDFFLIGTDALRARAFSTIIKDGIEKLGGELIGSHYSLVGELDFAAVVKQIEKSGAQVILNMLVGDSAVSFFRALVAANITPRALPVMSFTMSENELAQLSGLSLSGNYVARSRFPQVDPESEDAFSSRFQQKYGLHRPVSDIMEAAYYGVHLWAAAVEKAGMSATNPVHLALKQQEYILSGVRVSVDASTNHTWKVLQIGKLRSDNSIEVIQTAEAPLPPIPFPPPRARAEWESFSRALYEQWGGHWANPERPRPPKPELGEVRPRSRIRGSRHSDH